MNTSLQTFTACLLIACSGLVASTVNADDKAAGDAQAAAPASSEGKAILERAAAAAKTIQAAAYSIDTKTVGGLLEGSNPPSRAAVKALRQASSGIGVGGWLVQVSGSSTSGESSKPFEVVWKASSIEALDHDKKVLMERGGKSVMAPGVNVANRARLNEVLQPNPYQQALRAASFEVVGVETFDGVECDVVVAITESQTTKFAIARSDNFPRKIELALNNPSVQSTITTLITGVRIETDAANVTLAKAEDFKIALPEGFAEDRQAASTQPRNAAGAPVVATPKGEPTDAKPAEAQPEAQPEAKPEEKPSDTPSDKPRAEVPPMQPAQPIIAAGGEFTLKKNTGESFAFSDLKGKVVAVQFFGSWCLPCREWHGKLQEAVDAARDAKDVPMLAISTHERDSKNATSELSKTGWQGMHLVEGDKVADQWGVTTYPATFVVGAAGEVLGSWQGPPSETTFEEVTQAVRSGLAAAKRVAGV